MRKDCRLHVSPTMTFPSGSGQQKSVTSAHGLSISALTSPTAFPHTPHGMTPSSSKSSYFYHNKHFSSSHTRANPGILADKQPHPPIDPSDHAPKNPPATHQHRVRSTALRSNNQKTTSESDSACQRHQVTDLPTLCSKLPNAVKPTWSRTRPRT